MSDDSRVRMSIVGVVVLALFGALFARLWYLQVAAADEFHAAAAQSNAVRVISEPRDPRPDPRRRRVDVLVDNRVENVITIDRKISDARQEAGARRSSSTLLGDAGRAARGNLDDPRISPYTPVPVATDVAYDKLACVARAQGGASRACGPRRCRCAATRTAASRRTCSATSARSTRTS